MISGFPITQPNGDEAPWTSKGHSQLLAPRSGAVIDFRNPQLGPILLISDDQFGNLNN